MLLKYQEMVEEVLQLKIIISVSRLHVELADFAFRVLKRPQIWRKKQQSLEHNGVLTNEKYRRLLNGGLCRGLLLPHFPVRIFLKTRLSPLIITNDIEASFLQINLLASGRKFTKFFGCKAQRKNVLEKTTKLFTGKECILRKFFSFFHWQLLI